MNTRLILTASLALVLAGPAFAQDSYSTPPTDLTKTDESDNVVKTATVTRIPGTAVVLAPSVAPIISDSAPQPVAANVYDPRKDLMRKVYPTVDKGHTAGDPPVIDHSADIMPVSNPTTSVAKVPTGD